jgi:hypothetical protein
MLLRQGNRHLTGFVVLIGHPVPIRESRYCTRIIRPQVSGSLERLHSEVLGEAVPKLKLSELHETVRVVLQLLDLLRGHLAKLLRR